MSGPIISIILPLFGILITGYLSARFGIFKKGSSAIFSQFVFTVALPALALLKLSEVTVSEFFDWPFFGSLGGGMLITYGMAFLVARKYFSDTWTENGLHALTAMYSSTGYIGLPLILLVYGDPGLLPAIAGAVITGAVFLPIAIIIAELDSAKESKNNLGLTLVKVFASPVLLATCIGLLMSALNLAFPAPVKTTLAFFGDAYIPCALFAAGLFIAECSIKGVKLEIGWLVFLKLLAHPLITWFLAFHIFELNPMLASIVVIQAALPCGVPVFALAQKHNVFVVRSSAVIVISTALSVVSLSVLLILLNA
ncbi:MAG: AEC family transporter [Acidiferrobacterales bacterium]|nr:AEC family transporter [Acidiferrobacterales bacterium]